MGTGSQWNSDLAYAFSVSKIVTLPIGVWPLQDYNFFAKLRSVCCLTGQILVVILQYHELAGGCGDADANLDSFMLLACNIMAIMKISCYRIYADNLVRNFKRAVKDYAETRDPERLTVMKRHAYVGRSMGSGLMFFAYFSCVVMTIAPIFVGDVQERTENANDSDEALAYPMPSDCTLANFDVPTWLYCVIYVLDIVLLISTSFGNIGSDCLFVGITLHLCGQVELLKIDLEKLGYGSTVKRDDFDVLMRRHGDLLTLAKLLVEIVSVALIGQLFVSCMIMCLIGGFQLVLALQHNDGLMLLKSLMILSASLLELFAYSYVGDYLKSQMQSVGRSLFQCAWYELPIGWRKDLIFVLMRSQHTVQIAAANFFPVNMVTFMSIVKTSLSYLSVLRVMVTTA